MSDSSRSELCDEDPSERTHGADILDGKVNHKAQLHPAITEEDEGGSKDNVTSCDAATKGRTRESKQGGTTSTTSDTLTRQKRSPSSAAASGPPSMQKQNNARPQPQSKDNSNNNNAPSSSSSQRKGPEDGFNAYRPRRQSSVSRRYKRTACFVHSLLEVQQRFEKTSLNSSLSSIAASEENSRSTSPSGREAERLAHDSKRDLFTHLSKKEISDMALGVRELSKHLGSARLKLNIHHILVVTKTGDRTLISKTVEVTKWLLSRAKGRKEHQQGSNNATPAQKEERPLGYTVYIEKTLEQEDGVRELRESGHRGKLKFWTPELCTKSPHLFDFVITLGGDGTVLYSSWLFQRIVPPVLSFALGSLGFMTMFDYDNHERDITGVLQDGVTAALRMRIECTIYRANRKMNGDLVSDRCDLHEEIINTDQHGEDSEPTHSTFESFTVLNDLVVDRGPNPFMSSTELYGDDEHLTSIAADGVVISTPTGSTAYSLSAGGSLCHPEIPAILISPICPHTLSFRPLLVPDSMVLRVAVPYDSRSTAWASFDGRNRVELKQGDYVRISASRFPFPTCLRGKQTGDWFESISRTLNWNERKKQKSV